MTDYYLPSAGEEFDEGDTVYWTPEGRVSHFAPGPSSRFRGLSVVDVTADGRIGVVPATAPSE